MEWSSLAERWGSIVSSHKTLVIPTRIKSFKIVTLK